MYGLYGNLYSGPLFVAACLLSMLPFRPVPFFHILVGLVVIGRTDRVSSGSHSTHSHYTSSRSHGTDPNMGWRFHGPARWFWPPPPSPSQCTALVMYIQMGMRNPNVSDVRRKCDEERKQERLLTDCWIV